MVNETVQGVLGFIVMGVAAYVVVKYPSLMYQSVRDMQGAWRVAALLPLLVAIPVTVVTIVGLRQGSNLWPLLLIFAAPVLFVYQAALIFLHARIHKRAVQSREISGGP